VSLSYLDLQNPKINRIWAINKTPAKSRRQLIFTVQKNNGAGVDVVFIPTTWIPIDLTGQVPKKSLLQSSDFLKAVSNGVIEILSESEAASLNKKEGATQERERISMQLMNTNTVVQKDVVEDEDDSTKDELESSAKVVQFVEDMTVSDEISALNNLRSMGDLELQELRFVRKAAKEMSYTKVRKYCSLEIRRLKGEIDSGQEVTA
jgi:hypothetical protein